MYSAIIKNNITPDKNLKKNKFLNNKNQNFLCCKTQQKVKLLINGKRINTKFKRLST